MKLQDSYTIFQNRDDLPHVSLFMGVKTTGIFCRPGCPARLPNVENVVFFDQAEAALMAGFRPCKRCHPMNMPGEASRLIKKLITLVETEPDQRWSERDLQALGINPSTARRHFKNRFGITFTQYARQRRLLISAEKLHRGEKVIEAQLGAGFDSPSGFRDAFAKTFGRSPKEGAADPLLIDWLDTPLGPMVVIADNKGLYLCEFTDRKNLIRQVERLSKRHRRPILPGRTPITDETERQLTAYFEGTGMCFDIPIVTTGTDFQKQVWRALQKLPYGQTRAYMDLAISVGNEKAVRAVASSNASNGLAIIIPCHRVIGKNGDLGGYAGGLSRKSWLIDHEKRNRDDQVK